MSDNRYDIGNSQNEWFDDTNMVSEVEKLSNELRNRSLSSDDNSPIRSLSSEPQVTRDVKYETKDGVKEFEMNGKKYRRTYQRKIHLEKHCVKQLFTFSGGDDSILDIDVVSDPTRLQSVTELPADQDVFYNINTKVLSEEIPNTMSPKIIIRSIKSPNNSNSDNFKLLNKSQTDILSLKSVESDNEIASFTHKFGAREDVPEMLQIAPDVSDRLRISFLSQWRKSETCHGETGICDDFVVNGRLSSTSEDRNLQGKSKTISCVERFNTLSPHGRTLHSSTCVQITRSLHVRPMSASAAPTRISTKTSSGDSQRKSSNDSNAISCCDETKEMAWKSSSSISDYDDEDEEDDPLLSKLDVSQKLLYNNSFDPSSENVCKHISISAGHLDALIAHACSIGVNTTSDYHLFHKVFVVTYPLFITTPQLIQKLITRYKYFANNSWSVVTGSAFSEEYETHNETTREELLTAVINLMIEIINYWNTPLSDEVNQLLEDFSSLLNKTGSIRRGLLLNSAMRDHNNRLKILEARLSIIKARKKKIYSEEIASSDKQTNKSILEFDSRILAEQITLLESEVFDQVQLEDLLSFKNAASNPQLMSCVQFFNRLTYWVKTLLFSESTKSGSMGTSMLEKEKIFLKFIDILKILKMHQNYSSYTSILYSLIDFPDKLLSKRTRQKLAAETEFMSPSNKRQYIEAVHSAQPPFIPLLADVFSHLTRLNEIMPTFIKNPVNQIPEMINFKKMWNYFIIIQFFINKLQWPIERKYYNFKIEPEAILFINDFKHSFSESRLFECRENMVRSKSKKCHGAVSNNQHHQQNRNVSLERTEEVTKL